MPTVVRHLDQLPAGWTQASAPRAPAPDGVLVCPPDAFDIVDVKNAHMAAHVGGVDRARARGQWDALCGAFRAVGLRVDSVSALPGCEDMVFTANQTLTGSDASGRPTALLSRMRHASRQREVPALAAWFAERGWRVVDRLPESALFEGSGDVLWHPGRRLAWAAYGFRSEPAAHDVVAETFGADVLALRLVDERFYHLDTCLCPLDEHSALIVHDAFDDDGRALLAAVFDELVPCDPHEAVAALAGNAVVAPGGGVVIDRRAVQTIRTLRERGRDVVPVDTGEFLKSGGSVFCLKQWLWSSRE